MANSLRGFFESLFHSKCKGERSPPLSLACGRVGERRKGRKEARQSYTGVTSREEARDDTFCPRPPPGCLGGHTRVPWSSFQPPYVPSWLPSNQEPLLLARGWEVWKEELPSFYLPASVPQSPRPVCPSWLMGGTASPSIRNELISSTYALVFYYMGVSQVSHLLTSCLLPVFEL